MVNCLVWNLSGSLWNELINWSVYFTQISSYTSLFHFSIFEGMGEWKTFKSQKTRPCAHMLHIYTIMILTFLLTLTCKNSKKSLVTPLNISNWITSNKLVFAIAFQPSVFLKKKKHVGGRTLIDRRRKKEHSGNSLLRLFLVTTIMWSIVVMYFKVTYKLTYATFYLFFSGYICNDFIVNT